MREQGKIRLADRIIASCSFVLPNRKELHAWYLQTTQKLIDALYVSPIISADNVIDYRYRNWQDKYQPWDLMRDIPNVAAPFKECFIEMKTPHLYPAVKNAGILIGSQRFVDVRRGLPDSGGSPPEFLAQVFEAAKVNFQSPANDRLFLTTGLVIVERANGFMSLEASVATVGDETGKPLCGMSGAPFIDMVGFNEDWHAVLESSMFDIAYPALLAISFMHCKNVKIPPQEPIPKLSRAFQKRHGRPLLRYHTLEIEPMKKVLETEGEIGKNGLKRALHLCRGHFATYTPEKGMLGRKLDAPVTVWKPAHVRGSASEGIVAKDYSVKAPAA